MIYYICKDFTLVRSTGVSRFSFDAIKEVPLVDNEAETDSTIVKGLKGLTSLKLV
jgi:hypothetical protein